MATDMERFQSSADVSELSILLTDSHIDPPGPKIVYANPNCLRMTGYTLEELIGKTPRIFQGAVGTTINYRKDGSELLMSWTVETIFLDGIKHFYAIQTDLTNGLLKALNEVKDLQMNLLSKLPEKNNVSNSRQSISGSDVEGATTGADQGCCEFNVPPRSRPAELRQ